MSLQLESPDSWSSRVFKSLFPRKPRHTNSPVWLWAALESICFPLIALATGFWLRRDDPFLLTEGFPWMWIMPTVVALRYGSVTGTVSVVTLLLAWFTGLRLEWLPADLEFPRMFFLGGLVLILICGQFADVWNSRLQRAKAVNGYLDERLTALTKNHFLLRLSHERLERDLLTRPTTLRETLVNLRTLAARFKPGDTQPTADLPGAKEFIQLLAQTSQLEIASLYSVANMRVQENPEAKLGDTHALEKNNGLLTHALQTGELSHLQMADVQARRDATTSNVETYLVCAPLVDSGGDTLGMLTVEKLPFFALNFEALQLLTVLCGYYADGVLAAKAARPVLELVPHCPPEFALEIVRLHRIQQQAGLDSALVALVFELGTTLDIKRYTESLDFFEQVKRLRRQIDVFWEIQTPERNAIITLLPLAGGAGLEGYLTRIESALHMQTGKRFLEARIGSHTVMLGLQSPQHTLANLVALCHV